MNNLGWRGTRVKHKDGRLGVISNESAGQVHVRLTIKINGSDETDTVQLSAEDGDSGTPGWSFLTSIEGRPETWAPLGPREN